MSDSHFEIRLGHMTSSRSPHRTRGHQRCEVEVQQSSQACSQTGSEEGEVDQSKGLLQKEICKTHKSCRLAKTRAGFVVLASRRIVYAKQGPGHVHVCCEGVVTTAWGLTNVGPCVCGLKASEKGHNHEQNQNRRATMQKQPFNSRAENPPQKKTLNSPAAHHKNHENAPPPGPAQSPRRPKGAGGRRRLQLSHGRPQLAEVRQDLGALGSRGELRAPGGEARARRARVWLGVHGILWTFGDAKRGGILRSKEVFAHGGKCVLIVYPSFGCAASAPASGCIPCIGNRREGRMRNKSFVGTGLGDN